MTNTSSRALVPRLALLILIPLLAFAGRGLASPRPGPKLVVILVVDQMRADYVEKFGHDWTGGLHRLVTEGAWFRQAAYPYNMTVTCVSHSTIATGAFPATHGIVSSSWWDRDTASVVGCTVDPDASLVSYGKPGNGGTSTRHLRVPTLSDELRVQMPVAPRIVTLSLKDYTATTLAGRRADAATWFNTGLGTWVTSSAFATAPVPFVARFVAAHPVEADRGKSWDRLLPPAAYFYQDDAVGEQVPLGWTNTFPHVLGAGGGASFYAQWAESPFSDAYLGEMAEDAVDALKLGRGPGTDYLAVSFSALDLVGHGFGPRSQEVQDVLARLDRTIGSLLAHLDRTVGRANYVLALTADHGVAPIPEQAAAFGLDAGRITTADLTARVDKALGAVFGDGKYVARALYNDLYFAPGIWDRIVREPAALKAVLDAIRAMPGVERVFRGDELAGGVAAAGDRLQRAVAAGYFPGRSPDLVIIPRPYWFFTIGPASGGTSHGNPYPYDQRVPLFLLGRGIKGGQYLASASPADIAPTLAFLSGITMASADGRVLNEALAPLPARPAASRPAARER